jgi:hypothetical protein
MHQLKSILLLACLLCYTSAQAIWLSPDPLLDKYPYISPYAYCNWNPIKYIDPDGKWNTCKNGELVNSFNGTTAPIFSEPTKHLDKYKSETE